jgi:hypothetical protein
MSKAHFISVQEAKDLFSVETFSVVLNENSGKYSILLPDGSFLKIQQGLDKSLPMAFMTSVMDEFGNPDWFSGCLVNTNGNSPIKEQFSL